MCKIDIYDIIEILRYIGIVVLVLGGIGDEVLTNLEEGFSGGTIVEISDNIMKISLNPIDRRRKKKEILTRIVEPRVFPDKPFSDI